MICPKHGSFFQKAYHHLNYGCKKCGDEIGTSKRKTSLEKFIEKAKIKHGERYDYSLVNFFRQHDLIKIVCETHGVFEQAANDHLKGRGCNQCGIIKSGLGRKGPLFTPQEFIEKCRKIHGDTYDYTKTLYVGSLSKVIIICKTHGEFTQFPNNHLTGYGCKICGIHKNKAQNLWLDMMNISNENREYFLRLSNDTTISADGYDPKTRTVYEFWGDFWHGNPKIYNRDDVNVYTKTTFGYLYKKTLDKRKAILNSGYKLIEIWENDWRKINGNS